MKTTIARLFEEHQIENGIRDPQAERAVRQMIETWLHENPQKSDRQLILTLAAVRRVMISITDRLWADQPNTPQQDPVCREMLTEADDFWCGSMREHFVDNARALIADPKIVELFKESVADDDQPLNDFIDGLDEKIDQDLACFVFGWLSSH